MGGVTLSTLAFSSVVGQDDAKLALLLAAVAPRLGGVLLRGDKGSAKTTLARGLAGLLAPGAPFVELPLGASEDRVVGSVDVGALVGSNQVRFRPGLLAAADGGVLYVDEVNLLADHLVDTLLDVAVSGVQRIERDGFSQSLPARFVLIGSMNPEEGELRPQLLDRFGLAVDVRASDDPSVRAEIVTRQLAAEAAAGPRSDGAGGAGSGGVGSGAGDAGLAARLAAARPSPVGAEVVDGAARLALAVGAQGLRADLSLCRAAGALAGWEGRDEASIDDLRRVAPLVLAHRRRREPMEAPGMGPGELDQALEEALGPPPPAEGVAPPPPAPPTGAGPSPDGATHDRNGGGGIDGGVDGDDGGAPGDGGIPRPPAPAAEAPLPEAPLPVTAPAVGRRSAAPGATARRGRSGDAPRGRVVRTEPWSQAGQRVGMAATAVAAAVRGGTGEPLSGADLRAVVTEAPRARLIIVAVDASGSMAGRARLDAARATVLGLLTDAYRRRDRVAMVSFAGDDAEVVLRPTGSVEVARTRLAELRSGGTTPLGAGLRRATELATAARRDGSAEPVVVVLTDGRATSGGNDPVAAALTAARELAATGTRCLVLDAETGPVRLGLARQLAEALGADHVALDANASAVEGAIRAQLA